MIRWFFFLASLWLSTNVHAYPITAQSWLVATGDGYILESENIKHRRPIASITKLVTAMIVLDAGQDLDEYIRPYTRKELVLLSLIQSNNQASQTLCEKYPGGYSSCVAAMNRKAQELGMESTHFIDPTGLRAENVSTAEDLIKLVLAARKYDLIREASGMSSMKIKIRKKWLVFSNTNPIIGQRHKFIVSKTGWIRASGGCIVMLMDTDIGERLVIVLGSKNTHTRIPEAEFLAIRD